MQPVYTFNGGSGKAKNRKTRIGIIFYSDGDKEAFLRIVAAVQDDEQTSRCLRAIWDADTIEDAIEVSKSNQYASCDVLIAGKYDTVVFVPEAFAWSKFNLMIGFALDKRFGLQYLTDVFTGGADMQGANRHYQEKLHCKDGVAVVYSPSAYPTGGSMNGQQIKSLTSWHEFCTFIGHKSWSEKHIRRMWNSFVDPALRPRNRYKRRVHLPGEPVIDPDSGDEDD